MRSLIDVGTEILSNTPSRLYIFLGQEYGIKMKYAEIISQSYGGSKVECPSVSEIIKLMSTKQVVPLPPKLYIVRYDDEFASKLDDKLAKRLTSLKIKGTVILIYQNTKYASKLDKYLGEYCVEINQVSEKFIRSYLSNDFPNIPQNLIGTVAKMTTDYGQAQNVCICLSKLNQTQLNDISAEEVRSLFGRSAASTDTDLKKGIAAKNFAYLINVIDRYQEDPDRILYAILSTMIELDKVKSSKYSDSILKEYSKYWTAPDIYYMFNHTYKELKKLRSYSTADATSHVMYLISLLNYPNIPSLEDMKWN